MQSTLLTAVIFTVFSGTVFANPFPNPTEQEVVPPPFSHPVSPPTMSPEPQPTTENPLIESPSPFPSTSRLQQEEKPKKQPKKRPLKKPTNRKEAIDYFNWLFGGDKGYRPGDFLDDKEYAVRHDPKIRTKNSPVISLDLSETKCTDADLAFLKFFPKLRTLDLSNCHHLISTGLIHLRNVPALQNLRIKNCKRFTGIGLVHLKSVPDLRNFTLRYCRNLTKPIGKHLQSLTQLRSLILENLPRLADNDLIHFKKLSQLETLILAGSKHLTGAGLVHLNQLSKLKMLKLENFQKITHKNFSQFGPLPKLQSLEMISCFHQTARLQLAEWPKLETLKLQDETFYCWDKDKDQKQRKKLREKRLPITIEIEELLALQTLEVHGFDQLKHLSFIDVPKLRFLSLYDCLFLTDQQVKKILTDNSAAKKLGALELANCNQLTNKSIDVLKKLPKLGEVYLPAHSKITNTKVQELYKQCTIYWEAASWVHRLIINGSPSQFPDPPINPDGDPEFVRPRQALGVTHELR